MPECTQNAPTRIGTRAFATSRLRTPSTIRCNNDFALKQFTLDGLGLALFPRFFVERELESGKLVQAFLGFLKERFGPAA